MPIYLKNKISETVFLGVWKITEPLGYFESKIRLSESEKKEYNSFKNESRKCQWLSCRLLVNEFMSDNGLKGDILYNENGKPFLSTGHFISISHTSFFSAVIICKTKPVGVDIEKISSRILKIRSKIISNQEDKIIAEDDVQNLTTLWCSKEAIYKLCGISDLSFKNDIIVEGYNNNDNIIKAKVNCLSKVKSFELKRTFIEDHILVYLIDN